MKRKTMALGGSLLAVIFLIAASACAQGSPNSQRNPLDAVVPAPHARAHGSLARGHHAALAQAARLAMPDTIPACRAFNKIYRRAFETMAQDAKANPGSTGGDADLAFLSWMNVHQQAQMVTANDCRTAILNPKSTDQTLFHVLTYDTMLSTIDGEYYFGANALVKRYDRLVLFLRSVQISAPSASSAPSLPSSCTVMKLSSDLVTVDCN